MGEISLKVMMPLLPVPKTWSGQNCLQKSSMSPSKYGVTKLHIREDRSSRLFVQHRSRAVLELPVRGLETDDLSHTAGTSLVQRAQREDMRR